MTHASDCSIKEEARPEIDRIAKCFIEGTKERLEEDNRGEIRAFDDIDPAEERCHEMARGLGMKFQGSGVSRAVFSAVPDPTAPKSEPTATEFAECIMKFARHPSDWAGPDSTKQNELEVETWEDLSHREREGVNGTAPLFAPLNDYDAEDYRWLSQPFAPPPGNQAAVKSELDQLGLSITDIHSDNVGTYPDHGESAIIDYGVGEPDRFTVGPDASQFKQELANRGALAVQEDARNGNAEITWLSPEDLPGEGKPTEPSHAIMNRQDLVETMTLFFPTFPRQVLDATRLRNEAKKAIPLSVHNGVDYDIQTNTFGTETELEVEVRIPRNDPLPADLALEEYDNIVENYDDYFSRYANGYGGMAVSSQGIQTGVEGAREAADFEDALVQWRNSLEELGMRNVAEGPGGNPNLKFHGPLEVPGHPSPRSSSLWWDLGPANVAKVIYQPSEVTLPLNNIKARQEADRQLGTAASIVGDRTESINASVIGRIRFIEEDPVTRGDIYDAQYEIRHGGRYILPEETITILSEINDVHRQEFNPAEIAR